MDGPVLVANRGEIAVRILRACRQLGLPTVAVYWTPTRARPHVRMADKAVRLGPAPARESYLDGDRIVDAALAHGARAVHPGYGLLSEDAGFAAAVVAAGLTWVGPPAEVIARMGDKVAARAAARACGVAGVRGDGRARATPTGRPPRPRAIGFPLVVKASFGGGGRGMRIVRGADELADARDGGGPGGGRGVRPRRGLPRALPGPARHVEVQILADAPRHRGRARRPRLLRAATPPEAARGGPRPDLPAALRCGAARRRPAPGPRGRLPRRRHGRVPGRPRPGVRLPGDEHPAAGRARGDRAGHRRRPGGRAAPSWPRRAAAVSAQDDDVAVATTATRSRPGSRPRTRGRGSARRRAGPRLHLPLGAVGALRHGRRGG